MANSQDTQRHDPDLLAAVVLHTLVTSGREGITADDVAVACDRDPVEDGEMGEIRRALEILLADGLARRGGGGAFAPTRAALRAAELSF